MADPSSPYRSPSMPDSGQESYAASTSDRPISIVVFGILNMVFAALGVFGFCFGLIPFFMMRNLPTPNPAMDIMKENEVYFAFTIGSMILGFVAAIVLGIAGVGLLRMKPWGRHLSIGYAVYAIIAVVVGLIANWVWLIGPLFEKANQLPQGPEKAGAIGGVIGGTCGGCVGIVYPIVLLIFMSLPNLAKALRN